MQKFNDLGADPGRLKGSMELFFLISQYYVIQSASVKKGLIAISNWHV